MSPRTAAVSGALALSVALAFAGCGGDDAATVDSSSTQAQETAARGDGEQQSGVQSSNGKFNPEEIYRKVSPGVVTIISATAANVDDISGGSSGGGLGSGFVINEEGEILTNAHVVTRGGKGSPEGGAVTEAKTIFVQFADENRVSAKIVGVDPDSDVALIKVDPDGLDLVPLALSDGGGIVVGAPVAAIGSPFGEESSLSVGVISATDRTIESLTNFSIDGAIQTDASINPGNSGGPLLNAAAEVIGINRQIQSASGSSSGVGFAVPIGAVRYSLDQLREQGQVEYSFIGVSTGTVYPQLAEFLGLDVDSGALISAVIKGGPAEKAGLKAGDKPVSFQGQALKQGGDVIVAIDGKPVTSSSDVARLIANRRPGETLSFEVIRDGSHRNVDVTLGTRPEKPNG